MPILTRSILAALQGSAQDATGLSPSFAVRGGRDIEAAEERTAKK